MKRQHSNSKFDIREKKLARERAWGTFNPNNQRIEIDPRQLSKQYLYVLVHELLHMAQPELTEEGVVRVARIISKGVWQQQYRRLKP